MQSSHFTFLKKALYTAYLEARKGKRKTTGEHIFELNDMDNLMTLAADIAERSYRPSRSTAFIIRDPVVREIFAAPFRDRVVHHFIYNQVSPWWERHFIEDSYSCRKNKGTLYSQKRFEHHARSVSNNFRYEVFVAKLDIKNYFASLNRKKLYERAVWGLDQQFTEARNELYWTLRFLWEKIIFDDPVKGARILGNKTDWQALPKEKSLFYQKPGYGIVIGNLTSQLLSNIYLDQLDHYITFNLGYKHYGRYVDDFYIMVKASDKKKLTNDVKKIELFLDSLNLELHPKKRVFTELKHGVNFTGSTLFPGYILPGKRVRQNAKKAFYDFATGRGEIESVVSYLGHMKHINSTRFLADIFDSLGWDFEPTKNRP